MEALIWRTFSSGENESTAPSNSSDSLCAPEQHTYMLVCTVFAGLNGLLFFPTFVGIFLQLVNRRWTFRAGLERSSRPSSSSDLFIMNVILLLLADRTFFMLFTLKYAQVLPILSTQVLDALLCILLTVGPMTATGQSLDYYLAVVHPTSYKAIKASWRVPEVCTALTWLHMIVMETAILMADLKMHSLVGLITYYLLCPVYVFLSVTTLRALLLAGPQRQTRMSPFKAQVFKRLVWTLVWNLLHGIPMVGMLTYLAVHVEEEQVLFCGAFPMVMVVIIPFVSIALWSFYFYCAV